MTEQAKLDILAFRTFRLLRQNQHVLVTAESCTAGLIAATLARVPGISNCLAGSLVVYQIDSKKAWLDLPAEVFSEENAVSSTIAELMATQALAKTPHATISLSITGHLGPDAPIHLDGVAWAGLATRYSAVLSRHLLLHPKSTATLSDEQHLSIRHLRQQDAVSQGLSFLCDQLAKNDSLGSTAL